LLSKFWLVTKKLPLDPRQNKMLQTEESALPRKSYKAKGKAQIMKKNNIIDSIIK
jgi:hypothetical protein